MNLEHTVKRFKQIIDCLTVLLSFSSSVSLAVISIQLCLALANSTVYFHNICEDYTELNINLSLSLLLSPSLSLSLFRVCGWQRAVCRRPAREKCSRFIMILPSALQCPHKRLWLGSLHKSALTHLMKLNFPGPTEAARFT